MSVEDTAGRLDAVGPSIQLTGVDLSLGGSRILADVHLTTDAGASIAIVGPNGSGKTTLLRVLATLLRPSSGGGHVLGADITTSEISRVRPEIGLISHAPALIEELTLEENLRHFSKLSGRSVDSCLKALEVVGLERARGRRAADSSFGMRRRTEIAWLLVSKPKLLLLDEARTGLDTDAQHLVDALINTTRTRGGTVVGVSHEESQLSGFESLRTLVAGKLGPPS